MQRIQYIKTKNPDILTNKKPLVSNKGLAYYIKLDTKELTYEILHVKSSQIIRTGGKSVNNMNVLKRNIKKDLIELGVPLGTEIRDRTFGVCKKGYTQDKHEKS